jgi:hypothetical protein
MPSVDIKLDIMQLKGLELLSSPSSQIELNLQWGCYGMFGILVILACRMGIIEDKHREILP